MHSCTTSIVYWDAAIACSSPGVLHTTAQAISGRKTPISVYRQSHAYSNAEKRPSIIANGSDTIFLLFYPCLHCYSAYCHHLISLSDATNSPQPIRAQFPPYPVLISQIGLTKLLAKLLKFFGFYFFCSCACQKNYCGEGTNINSVDLHRSNIKG